MALHIRDFRQSDAGDLSRLRERARLIGSLPEPDINFRILVGLRKDQLAGAIWMSLSGETGLIPAMLVINAASWQSDARELIAEASLWHVSCGAAAIELRTNVQDAALLPSFLDMGFKADLRSGVLSRRIPARSAA